MSTAPVAGDPCPGCAPSAELRLVLHLVRAALGAGGGGGPPPPEGPELDWAAFAAHVSRHRLAPFLAHRLPAGERASLPPGVMRSLLEGAIVTRRRGQLQAALLGRVLRLLDGEGVAALSIKGPALAQRLHGGIGARHAGDLDLLVRAADVERADALLRGAGLRREVPGFDLSPRQREAFRELWHEYGYVDPETGVRVELAWRLVEDGVTDEVWREPPRVVELEGRPIGTLAPQTEALYLLLHGAKHGWSRLFWLVDVALALGDASIDWPALVARAERHGVRRAALQGIHLAHGLLGVPLPRGVPASAPRDVRGLVRDACLHIGGPVYTEQRGALLARRALYTIRMHDGWPARARELRRSLLSPFVWETLPLPDRWFALYYLAGPALRARHMLRRMIGGNS